MVAPAGSVAMLTWPRAAARCSALFEVGFCLGGLGLRFGGRELGGGFFLRFFEKVLLGLGVGGSLGIGNLLGFAAAASCSFAIRSCGLLDYVLFVGC